MDQLNDNRIEIFSFLEPQSTEASVYDILEEISQKQEIYIESREGWLAALSDLRQSENIKVSDTPSRNRNILDITESLCEKYPNNVRSIPSFYFSVNRKSKIINLEEIIEFTVNMDDDVFLEIQNERNERSRSNILELMSLFKLMNLTRLFRDAASGPYAMELVKADEAKNLFLFKQYSFDEDMNLTADDYCFHKKNFEKVEAGLDLDEVRRIIAGYSENLMSRMEVVGVPDTDFTGYKDTKLNYLIEVLIDELAQYPAGPDLLIVKNFASIRECLLGVVDQIAHPLFSTASVEETEEGSEPEETRESANVAVTKEENPSLDLPIMRKLAGIFSSLIVNKKNRDEHAVKTIEVFLSAEIFIYASHVFLSVLLGILAGGGGILFHFLLESFSHVFEHNSARLSSLFTEYYIVFVPVLGAMITSTMTYIAPAVAKQKGVVTVIKAILLNQGFIPIKETIFHLIAPIISIGTGIPLGPEGPSAKIGGGIGSFMSQVLKLKKSDMMMYTVAGAGAAISAVFNAPIAGVFFGIEVVLLNDMRNRALSALIISSVVADIMSRAFLGYEGVIHVPEYSLGAFYTYPFFLGLAVFCGIIALAYFYLSDLINNIIEKHLKISNPYLKILPASFVFGIVLLKFPQLYGLGYGILNDVLHGDVPVAIVAAILGLKLFFVVLFSKAGAYGGSFAPSLGLGAFAGYIFAYGMNYLFGVELNPAAYALVGMGGVLSGVNSIPLTSMLLVFEVTSDYKFILPLMLVSMVSHLVVLYFKKGTAYSIDLLNTSTTSGRSDLDILKKTLVKDILRDDIDKVDSKMPLRDAMNVLLRSGYGEIIVVDADEALVGVLSLKDVNLRQVLLDNTIMDKIISEDIALAVPFAAEDEPLHVAIQKMETDKSYIENIPVVSSKTNKFVGIITHGDIMQAYEKQLNADNTDSFTGNYL
ncbi:MAG: chloride channel protein [Spirochaetia bacterium]|jgi:CIC family chloride channel protein|nr:chloride channel protein [Spirochaetia bacterium]